MLAKVMFGVSAAMLIALVLVGNMLLKSKEANGVLIQGIENAQGINRRQDLVLQKAVEQNANLLAQFEAERVKTEAATKALAATQEGLTAAEADFERRMKDVLDVISDEDLVCAAEFVPQPLIDSLRSDNAGSP